LGNVVGSNIANIALILGLASLVRPIRIHSRLVSHEIPVMIFVTVLMIVFFVGGRLSVLESGVLVAGMAAYIGFGILDARKLKPEDVEAGGPESGRPAALPVSIAFVVAGCLALAFGGGMLVGAAAELARAAGISEAVIGLTLVAVGTSLPELAASLVAAFKGKGDLAVGNIVGSNIFNILFVLGLPSLLVPVQMGNVGWGDMAVMAVFAVALLPLARSGVAITRLEGALLLAGYVVYLGLKATGTL
jgi:cation:H+ antiporter